MGSKQFALAGLIAAVLALGLAAPEAATHAPAGRAAHHNVAEGKGPTRIAA